MRNEVSICGEVIKSLFINDYVTKNKNNKAGRVCNFLLKVKEEGEKPITLKVTTFNEEIISLLEEQHEEGKIVTIQKGKLFFSKGFSLSVRVDDISCITINDNYNEEEETIEIDDLLSLLS